MRPSAQALTFNDSGDAMDLSDRHLNVCAARCGCVGASLQNVRLLQTRESYHDDDLDASVGSRVHLAGGNVTIKRRRTGLTRRSMYIYIYIYIFASWRFRSAWQSYLRLARGSSIYGRSPGSCDARSSADTFDGASTVYSSLCAGESSAYRTRKPLSSTEN